MGKISEIKKHKGEYMMTIQGAIKEIDNLIDSKDIPIYYKPSLKKIRETIITECQSQIMELKDKIEHSRDTWNYYGNEYERATYEAYDRVIDIIEDFSDNNNLTQNFN